MTGRGSFTHLHVHTEYSMLDGAARIGEVVGAAVADGQPAIGITDHGNMYGILDFYRECRRQGVKPILGTEAYMAHDSRHERPARRGRIDDSGGDADGGKKLYYHLTLLAEDNTGYRNLIQLASRAFMEGYYYKPRVDWDTLSDHAGGLIATTGCLGGHVLQSLMQGDVEGATAKAARLQDIFGKDNLFVEIQDHGIPEQHKTNPQLLDLARRIGAPVLATNDSHYVHRGDAVAHDALLCVQTGSLMSDPNRFKFHGDEHYLKSAAEMRSLFSEVPESCDNTLWIAERADVEIDFGKPQLPNFPLPEGFAGDGAYLRHLTFEGARERWGAQLPDDVVERLAYELRVIEDMGFSSYFLIVWDLIAHARRSGIRVGPGRGSAAGCAVAYCLRITDLDPIRYDLLFERFLNPSRISMPDIDMDFDSRYRDEMIRYAAERYGRDHVAQIVTFSTIKARAAVRDAARVLGHPYIVGDKVAKAMPPLIMGRDTPLYACLEPHPKFEDGYKMAGELREMYEADPDTRQVIDVAKGLEGLRRQDGIHAAAVVITKEPLTEYLPIQRKPENGLPPEEAPVVTQYEMHGVEDLGLLKMDFLGLRNLDVISDTIDVIRESRGVELDIDNVPLDDPKTYELLQRGDTIGVFQLEGGPMRALIRSLAPTCFEDVAALVALYRPGPMAANMHNDYADRKNGRKPVAYLHPDAEEILGDTWGLMIYQESVMRIAQRFAGYSLAEADNLRKACLPRGTRVLTKSRGYVPIEKLSGLSDRRVQTIDTTSCTSRYEPVADVWSVGVKPVYRLTTSTGYTIEATDDHPFLIEGEWRPLREITPGDLVGVARRTMTDGGSKVTDAEIDLAALLISEGYTPDLRTGLRRQAHFSNTDPELLDAFRAAFADHFGYAHTRRTMAGTVTQLRLTREELLALEPNLGTLGLAADKDIPFRIVNAPLPRVRRFLGLYFCADGWADRSGVHYGSKSRRVCHGLKRMLLRCGIVANLHSRQIAGYGAHWTLSVADKGQAKAFARMVEPHLTAIKAEKVGRWLVEWGERASATNIGIPSSFLVDELARRQKVTGRTARQLGVDTGGYARCRVLHRDTLDGLLYSERLEDLRTGDLVWDTVVSVEYVGEVECFDFRMADPERPYAVVEDFLVHNCGKKVRELIAKERSKFVEGCEQTGYGAELGTQWFDIIEPFADYAFNKSHSFGYGYVAYQTAFLKANYPAEYLAALLTSVKANLDKAAVYLAECRTMGIAVQVPDINRSASDFTPVVETAADGSQTLSIIFGLSAVRNVGEGLVGLIEAEREANGPFVDFYDFAQRVDTSVLNKRTVESLIKAGAFDDVGHPRKGLLTVFEQILDHTLARRRERDMGIMTLFGGDGDGAPGDDFERTAIPEIEFDKRDRLAFEKEMLGLYVSDHPLLGAEAALARRSDATIDDLADLDDGTLKTVGGVITGLQRKWTRKGDLMAVFTLEDLRSAVEVMVFPRTMTEHGHKLADDAVVVVRARVDKRDDTPKLIAQDIEVVEVNDGGTADPLRLRVPPQLLSAATVAHLKQILADHPGPAPVMLHLGERQIVRLPDRWNVDTSNGLLGQLRVVLGAGAIVA
ncbi:MAG TPA: DNA polymerase III subunit alpha [Acidimicrobiales bacterium]|nr:DNA polymerase III subunit alpha [Acidimicrobiales bacterium]